MIARISRPLTIVSVALIIGVLLTACGPSALTPAPTAAVPTAAPAAPTAAVPTAAAAAPAIDTAALDAFLLRMMEEYQVPGAAIALVLPDGRSYTQGYGVRDTSTGAPVTPDTQFTIASVTKSFTALGVMLLVEEGRVDLDERVTAYLPDFRLSDPAATERVTVRHLLTHTSGMERNNAATGDPTITRDEVVALAAETPLVAAPGAQYVYSNIHTVAAGRIIEVVSGQSWEAFTRERILEPLGMEQTSLDVTALQQQLDYAVPHDRDLLAGVVPAAFLELGAEAPAGGINASASAMLRYLQFQLGDGTAGAARLLSAESLAELHRTQIAIEETGPVSQARLVAEQQGLPAPESLVRDFGYGLYWITEEFQGHRVVQHDGQSIGFSASASFAPEAEVGVAVLTNMHYAYGFVETVRSHILEELLDVTPRHDTYAIVEGQLALLGLDQVTQRQLGESVGSFSSDPAQLEALAGSYTNLLGEGPVVVTAVEGRALRLEAEILGFDFALDLLPVSPDTFLVNTSPLRGYSMRFSADAEGTTILMNGTPLAERPGQPE